MNKTSLRKISFALLAFGFLPTVNLHAQAPHQHAPGHEHAHAHASPVSAGSLPEAWQKSQAAFQAMQKAAAEKQILPMHAEQEKLAALLEQIRAKAGADNARLEGAIKNAMAASERVHLASDANDFAKASADLQTLAATMAILEKQLTPLLAAVGTSSVKAEWIAPAKLEAGKTVRAILRLTAQGKPVTLEMLEVAHTEKLHLLIIEQTLTDYHHEHPVAGEKPGEYAFDFTPRFGGNYSIWADVLPTATGQQEYAKTQIQVEGPPPPNDKSVNTAASAGGLRFQLKTETGQPLRAGAATVVEVTVTTPDAKEFTQLEPVMGAFAHMVAFPEDVGSVMHVHPMGKEPEAATERGGPRLSFHVEPEKAGFHRFFLQVQVNGEQLFASFGQEVQPAGPKAAGDATGNYVCPMHPEVVSDKPGKCPKCGMSLVAR